MRVKKGNQASERDTRCSSNRSHLCNLSRSGVLASRTPQATHVLQRTEREPEGAKGHTAKDSASQDSPRLAETDLKRAASPDYS